MRCIILSILLLSALICKAQTGVLSGNVLDEKRKALAGATIQLISFKDNKVVKVTSTDKEGSFSFEHILFGYHQLHISFVGFTPLIIDSIYFRAERFDFNLNDLELKYAGTERNLREVIVYAEKPLIESKEGNIIFNVGESALSASSNASDLLVSVPLVTKDPAGNINVRGKEPKILIDDKPVGLNLQQLQDLLESLPGSSIEKIEVLTNPPPQYANEAGGVINIVTRKGKVGSTGRLTLYSGTRGEAGLNGNYNYRKQGVVVNINAGAGYNEYIGEGHSTRANTFKDSSNHLNTDNNYKNKSFRPNLRANLDYDVNKQHALNVVLQYNQNNFNNNNHTKYQNFNRFEQLYKLSHRINTTTGDHYIPNLSLNYTYRGKKPGKILRLFTNFNVSESENDRLFYNQYYHPDQTHWYDSTQQQITDNQTTGYNFRISYDMPLGNRKTSISIGSFYAVSNSHVVVGSYSKSRDADNFKRMDSLSNDFRYHQYIKNARASVKHVFGPGFSITAGANVEATDVLFELYRIDSDTSNRYWSFLPFVNFNRNWENDLTITASYRRTIRRPGINEQNPSIDFSDAYNIRMGNPDLKASLAHNIDVVFGKTKAGFYANLGFGYNIVEDIFSQIRVLLPDEKTKITWQNISGRKEYEVSSWSGYTLSKKVRLNLSASYIYNVYSDFDKKERNYRDGASFNSNLNSNFSWKDLYIATGSFTYNRFANPQGKVKSSLSMNVGLQARILEKKMTITVNAIDPLVQQQNRTFTYGKNFSVASVSATQTRSYRLSVGYTFSKRKKEKGSGKKL
jgi:hypothetical protein